jgi:MFS family permease
MRESRLARITLLVLFWANFLNFLDRQVVAALAPLLKAHWQLSDYQVGLLATAFEVPYALAPVPIAILGDRWTRRRIVALAVSLWSAAMALERRGPIVMPCSSWGEPSWGWGKRDTAPLPWPGWETSIPAHTAHG